jgi:hypothetical protein
MSTLTTTRLASYFDDHDSAPASYSLGSGKVHFDPDGATLGVARAVPNPGAEIMGKPIETLTFVEAHIRLKYENHLASKLHDEIRVIYLAHGSSIPGFEIAGRVLHIKKHLLDSSRQINAEYDAVHPKPEDMTDKKAKRKYFRGRQSNLRKQFVDIHANIGELTGQIEALYRAHVGHSGNPENVPIPHHAGGYYVLPMQKWCNTAVYSLMKVAEHHLHQKTNQNPSEKEIVRISHAANQYAPVCHQIRQRLKTIRDERPRRKTGKKSGRKPKGDLADLEAIRLARHSHTAGA